MMASLTYPEYFTRERYLIVLSLTLFITNSRVLKHQHFFHIQRCLLCNKKLNTKKTCLYVFHFFIFQISYVIKSLEDTKGVNKF